MTTFRDAFPILYVDDVDQAAELYRTTFGFEETFRHENDAGVADFAFLTLDPLGIGIGKRPDDDEVLPPTDQPWGERICSYIDPNGHLIHVGSRQE